MRGFPDIDLVIARLADGQWGIVHRAGSSSQRASSPDAIDRRLAVAAGCVRLHRGVYAVGHRALRPEAYRLAAVLACGGGAVLSHAAARRTTSSSGRVARDPDRRDASRSRPARRHPGIRVHRRAALRPEECERARRRAGHAPPARTLLDLAATFPRRTVERALDQAEVLRAVRPRRPRSASWRPIRGRPGSAAARRRCFASTPPANALTRSELEDAFLVALRRRTGIARPRVQRDRLRPRGRLPLAAPPARRRGGRLDVPPHAPGVRARPRARRDPRRRRASASSASPTARSPRAGAGRRGAPPAVSVELTAHAAVLPTASALVRPDLDAVARCSARVPEQGRRWERP